MSYFTKKLYTKQTGFMEFSFNGIDTVNGTKFHITVLCDSCQHIHFLMQECKGGWEFINAPLPPQWVLNFENELSRAINEALAEAVPSA
jgi:hypothetical protein